MKQTNRDDKNFTSHVAMSCHCRAESKKRSRTERLPRRGALLPAASKRQKGRVERPAAAAAAAGGG